MPAFGPKFTLISLHVTLVAVVVTELLSMVTVVLTDCSTEISLSLELVAALTHCSLVVSSGKIERQQSAIVTIHSCYFSETSKYEDTTGLRLKGVCRAKTPFGRVLRFHEDLFWKFQ